MAGTIIQLMYDSMPEGSVLCALALYSDESMFLANMKAYPVYGAATLLMRLHTCWKQSYSCGKQFHTCELT